MNVFGSFVPDRRGVAAACGESMMRGYKSRQSDHSGDRVDSKSGTEVPTKKVADVSSWSLDV